LGIVSLPIDSVFYSAGAALILYFSLVEIAALGFFFNAIQAND
jgi:uncharacterized membrane protein